MSASRLSVRASSRPFPYGEKRKPGIEGKSEAADAGPTPPPGSTHERGLVGIESTARACRRQCPFMRSTGPGVHEGRGSACPRRGSKARSIASLRTTARHSSRSRDSRRRGDGRARRYSRRASTSPRANIRSEEDSPSVADQSEQIAGRCFVRAGRVTVGRRPKIAVARGTNF